MIVNESGLRSPRANLRKIATVVLSALLFSSACYEEDMTVLVEEQMPVTFKLSGSGYLHFFAVWEVSVENQSRIRSQRDAGKNRLLWKLSPDSLTESQKVVSRLPPITYGSIPQGFVQKEPQEGAPAELVEGKIYEAGGPAYDANGGFVWFTIKGARVVKIEAPGGN